MLLETARTWLAVAGSTSAAAERLHIHRNTVRYRLQTGSRSSAGETSPSPSTQPSSMSRSSAPASSGWADFLFWTAFRLRSCDATLRPMTAHRGPELLNHHPAVVEDLTRHAGEAQLRIADAITKYAGSMRFVYVHIALFALWMLVLERSPWPTLTLVVSLEAIFLSTFVMIGQNRQATFQQQKADHDFLVEEHELNTNTELTRAIERLTREIHRAVVVTGPESASE